ncbi:hypothetical protein BOTBODRAFT_184155 [Botryobasidium botryosum FD-172 SS1]|uniref:Uncharacterized protein n=1 Tax=Botryobasidium botryosum (strain FD-172 SS1) TaxID=930990 RepID=A0A067MX51_BOTB1|nr:hypothetical protein BOTBODRAFT_184155 [Botryobasidium botryosum FD-172 SS1]
MSANPARVARVHNNPSNRANQKNKSEPKSKKSDATADASDRRVVFKSVLDNPLRINWPNVPLNIQNAILACLLEVLYSSGIAEYHIARQEVSHRGKRGRRKLKREGKAREKGGEGKSGTKRKREADETSDAPMKKPSPSRTPEVGSTNVVPDELADALSGDVGGGKMEVDATVDAAEPTQILVPPDLLSHLVIGINEVTKRLEEQTLTWRTRAAPSPPVPPSLPYSDPPEAPPADKPTTLEPTASASTPASTPAPASAPTPDTTVNQTARTSLRIIFACRSDVDPPALLAHLPMLTAACNSARAPAEKDDEVRLVALPKGAEYALAQAAGLRRVSVLAIDSTAPNFERIAHFLVSIPVLKARWLVPSTTEFVPTHIKQLRTTQPKDLRASKEKRAQGRAEAKAKKKSVTTILVLKKAPANDAATSGVNTSIDSP